MNDTDQEKDKGVERKGKDKQKKLVCVFVGVSL